MNIEAIAIGDNPPEDVNVIIEVPIGGEPIKYEMNKAAGALFVDRFLYTPMRYPGNYGFVPHTLSDDGDPIDVLVANSRPIAPGAIINVRPIGVLKMDDEGGGDEKIIAVPMPKLTQRYAHVTGIADMPQITIINRYDLYSKADDRPKLDELRPYYEDLTAEFFPQPLNW